MNMNMLIIRQNHFVSFYNWAIFIIIRSIRKVYNSLSTSINNAAVFFVRIWIFFGHWIPIRSSFVRLIQFCDSLSIGIWIEFLHLICLLKKCYHTYQSFYLFILPESRSCVRRWFSSSIIMLQWFANIARRIFPSHSRDLEEQESHSVTRARKRSLEEDDFPVIWQPPPNGT